MNEFQEAILDTLMVAEKIGDRWKPGPLPLALGALRNAGLTQRDEPAVALGYPALLCAAVEGASTTIRTVDDCRTLAISLFTEVTPRKRAPKLGKDKFVAAALWSIRQVPVYHAPEGVAHAEVPDLLEEYLDGRSCAAEAINRLDERLDRAISATDGSGKDFVPRRLSLSAFYFALHTLRRVQKGDDAERNACLVTRDVARLAGLVRGLPARCLIASAWLARSACEAPEGLLSNSWSPVHKTALFVEFFSRAKRFSARMGNDVQKRRQGTSQGGQKAAALGRREG
jgi:hypothetical protein